MTVIALGCRVSHTGKLYKVLQCCHPSCRLAHCHVGSTTLRKLHKIDTRGDHRSTGALWHLFCATAANEHMQSCLTENCCCCCCCLCPPCDSSVQAGTWYMDRKNEVPAGKENHYVLPIVNWHQVGHARLLQFPSAVPGSHTVPLARQRPTQHHSFVQQCSRLLLASRSWGRCSNHVSVSLSAEHAQLPALLDPVAHWACGPVGHCQQTDPKFACIPTVLHHGDGPRVHRATCPFPSTTPTTSWQPHPDATPVCLP